PITQVPHNPPLPRIGIQGTQCTADDPCQHDTVIQFLDESQPAPDSGLVQWAWVFGDGTPQFLCTNPSCKNPQHTYIGGGVFIVSLTIWDSFGVSATTTREVHVQG